MVLLKYSFKWQYVAGAGYEAEIMDTGGTGTENNFGSAARLYLDLRKYINKKNV